MELTVAGLIGELALTLVSGRRSTGAHVRWMRGA